MTEVLCVAYTYTSTFATQSARTTPLSFFDDGLHNFVVRNCVAVKPLRAGAHSSVQAHSFHYYGINAYDPPHLHQHLGKSNSYCVRFFFYLLMRGYTTMLHFFLPIALEISCKILWKSAFICYVFFLLLCYNAPWRNYK